MGGSRCTAPNCSSTNAGGFSLFRYPRDETLQRKWLEAINRPDWKPYSGARLCEVWDYAAALYVLGYILIAPFELCFLLFFVPGAFFSSSVR